MKKFNVFMALAIFLVLPMINCATTAYAQQSSNNDLRNKRIIQAMDLINADSRRSFKDAVSANPLFDRDNENIPFEPFWYVTDNENKIFATFCTGIFGITYLRNTFIENMKDIVLRGNGAPSEISDAASLMGAIAVDIAKKFEHAVDEGEYILNRRAFPKLTADFVQRVLDSNVDMYRRTGYPVALIGGHPDSCIEYVFTTSSQGTSRRLENIEIWSYYTIDETSLIGTVYNDSEIRPTGAVNNDFRFFYNEMRQKEMTDMWTFAILIERIDIGADIDYYGIPKKHELINYLYGAGEERFTEDSLAIAKRMFIGHPTTFIRYESVYENIMNHKPKKR
jgi:hypothetical protein